MGPSPLDMAAAQPGAGLEGGGAGKLRSGSPPRVVEAALEGNEAQLAAAVLGATVGGAAGSSAAAASAGQSQQHEQHAQPDVWIFGYGSLIYRPDMEYTERHRGHASGYVRRFWQLSPDHRGTPEFMGRVCTMFSASLLQTKAAGLSTSATEAAAGASPPAASASAHPDTHHRVHGDVFKLAPCSAASVLAKLCHRERAGYEAYQVAVECEDGVVRQAWAFAAGPGNTFFAGLDEREEDTAAVIATAEGPSGTNLDYFLHLLLAMRTRGVEDDHLEGLWARVAAGHPAAVARAEELARAQAAVGTDTCKL